jgi:hypothetical protein
MNLSIWILHFVNNTIFSNNVMEFNIAKHEGGEEIMKLLLDV